MASVEIGFIANQSVYSYIETAVQPNTIAIRADGEGSFRNAMGNGSNRPIDIFLASLIVVPNITQVHRLLQKGSPATKIIALIGEINAPLHPTGQSVSPGDAMIAATALKQGALGVIQLNASSIEYQAIITKTQSKRASIEPHVATALLPSLRGIALSPEETNILKILVNDPIKQCATQLGKTEDFIEKCLYNVISRIHS